MNPKRKALSMFIFFFQCLCCHKPKFLDSTPWLIEGLKAQSQFHKHVLHLLFTHRCVHWRGKEGFSVYRLRFVYSVCLIAQQCCGGVHIQDVHLGSFTRLTLKEKINRVLLVLNPVFHSPLADQFVKLGDKTKKSHLLFFQACGWF